MRPIWATSLGRLLLPCLLGVLWFAPRDAQAVLSESEGTGVWEVQSAESQRAATLQLGFFGSLQRLDLRDSSHTNLNALEGGVNGAFGFPGGFEISGSLPLYGFYTTAGDLGNPLDQNISVRLGDVAGRLRWSGPLGVPGLRWGVEGGVQFPTGSDRVDTYPGRGAAQPYSATENQYTGRSMLTWDGLRAGSGLPIRLHANAGYTIQRDENRFLAPRAPLPLELPAPTGSRDNDYLSLGGAVELDLTRLTLFGEIVTDQFVNERSLLRGKENRLAVTPGARLWLPGGISLAGGYTINLAEDDPATAFNPDRAWPDHEWRAAFSLGTVYRGARARVTEQRVAVPPVPVPPAATPEAGALPAAPAAPIAPRMMAADTTGSAADSITIAKREKERRILERREVQEEPAKPARTKIGAEIPPTAEPSVPAAPAAPKLGGVPAPAARPVPGYVDTDGDGIPDSQDQCPLLAEDWDGFQDLDGCPDLDNDQDGIPDVRDQCPNDPETYNGYYDFDGCPDALPPHWIGPRMGVISEPPETGSQANAPTDTVRVATAVRVPPQAARPSPEARSAREAAPRTSPGAPPEASLESRVARLESENQRRGAAGSVQPDVVVAPQPASTGIAPPAPGTDSGQAARLAALEASLESRMARLEWENQRRGEVGSVRPNVVVAPQPASTVITPSAPGTDPGQAARLAALEAEVRLLREQARTTPGAPRDTTQQMMLRRLELLQASIADLASRSSGRNEEAPVAKEEVGTEEVAAAEEVPQAQPTENPAAVLDALLPLGVAKTFPEVQFAPGNAALDPAALETLNAVARALRSMPEARVTLIGHTDDVGGETANLRLSRERARAVAGVLFASGVARAQVSVIGRGETAPVAPNDTEAGRRANRRVEFVRNH